MTDANGTARTAKSSAVGSYRFSDVAAGETYIFTAIAKRFEFSQPTLILNIGEDTQAVDFIAALQ